jgi:RNA recognition motif-containing protein
MTNRKLFIGNLSARVTEDGLRFLFSKQGEISEIALTVERTAGRSRAFAVVTMATAEGAEAALQSLHRHIWNGRHITVNEARTEEEVQSVPITQRLSISAQKSVSPFFPIKRNSGA